MAQKIQQMWKHKDGNEVTLAGIVDHSRGETRVDMLKTQLELLRNSWDMENETIEEIPDRPIYIDKLSNVD